jgi:hypothetical protein
MRAESMTGAYVSLKCERRRAPAVATLVPRDHLANFSRILEVRRPERSVGSATGGGWETVWSMLTWPT